ncbi:MAG: excisionase family DNA-binding protein [Geodermatophilaceae bacterium]
MPEHTLLLTPEAGADRLSIGRSQMYELIRRGEVRSVKIGRLRRIPAAALADYVAALLGGQGDEAA